MDHAAGKYLARWGRSTAALPILRPQAPCGLRFLPLIWYQGMCVRSCRNGTSWIMCLDTQDTSNLSLITILLWFYHYYTWNSEWLKWGLCMNKLKAMIKIKTKYLHLQRCWSTFLPSPFSFRLCKMNWKYKSCRN